MKNPYELAGSVLQASSNEKNEAVVSDSFTSIELYGASVQAKDSEDTACSHFHLENESGTGDITLYTVFPGIELVYNDMHMASGDLSFCSLQENFHQSEFPTAHYHGITITIDFSGITEEMKYVLELLSVDMERIQELSRMREFIMIRANETTSHIFSELYRVPEKIRLGYIRVKVLELLLVLTELDISEDKSEHARFSGVQIEVIKKVHALLVADYAEHYTIDELSERFEMSPTVLKKCFKGVYGDSIYSYMKRYRLQVAEQLLRESTLTIGEIAAKAGYLNPNKFTSAFRAEYGMTPTAYRKEV